MNNVGAMLKDKIGNEVNKEIGLTGMEQPAEYLKASSEITKDINEKNEVLKGGKSDKNTLLDLAMRHAYDDATDSTNKTKINKMFLHLKKQLNKGIKVEMEHTKSKKIATEIAKDHLSEDPSYYSKLEKMEANESIIRREINNGTNNLVGNVKMNKPIGKLTTIGKVESKEATGASSAGQFSGSLFSMFSKDKSKVDKETPKLKKEETKEGCWKGYKQVGMKEKNGKQVPNCVKNKKSVNENEIISESENTPTNPQLWARAKSMAKSKFKVYPCVPMDSQALTKSGWKYYHELSVGEEILTYNQETGFTEWEPIDALQFFNDAPLVRLFKSNTNYDIRCTPNHKWVLAEKNTKYPDNLVEAQDITKRMKIKTSAPISINQQNDLDLRDFSKTESWVQKVLMMSVPQIQAYFASGIVYDGNDKGFSAKKDKHTYGFTQKNKDHGEAMEIAAVLLGHRVSIYQKKHNPNMMGWTFITRNFESTQNLNKEDAGREDVWCPTTKNKTWIMKQKGYITITGNSAYANGWAAKWYKSKGGGWKKKKKKESKESKEKLNEDLRRWFKEKWVDVSKKVDGKHPPCGRKDAEGKSYPKCRPSKKVSKETPKVASSYSKDEKKSMTQQKRRAEKKEPKVGKGNKPTMTHFDEVKKIETKEATGASSSGQYSTPQIWAKSMGKKNWKPSRKTQIPGGKFVTVKEKCKKFPYCNQGDIKALNIFENETLKNVIKNIENKHGISENIIKAVIQYEIEKLDKKK